VKLQIKKFKNFSNRTGSLVPFYANSHFKNFKLKRFFFIYGNTKHLRADHAHKRCNQILIPIFGKIKVEITNIKKKSRQYILSLDNKTFLNVPKKNWIKLKFMNKNSILMTLCDYKYDKKEYIQTKKEFFKI
tara:strand:+ start:9588 stop:9983 length:396 start_codon:yes stop_codon:yes gene_type:complete